MKTKTHKFYLVLFCLTSILFSACQKEELPVSGTLSGTLTVFDPSTPLVKKPVEGIKLYLINADYKSNTVTNAGNRAAIVDSTLSDAKGNYRFTNIPFGSYLVIPFPDTSNYRFEPMGQDVSNPLKLNESTPNQSVSYSSPIPGGQNGNQFIINLKIKGNWSTTQARFWKRTRQYYCFGIPYMEQLSSLTPIFHYDETDPTFTYMNDCGYQAFFSSMTNNFVFSFYDKEDKFLVSYLITYDIYNTPAESWWTIDLEAHTISCTKSM